VSSFLLPLQLRPTDDEGCPASHVGHTRSTVTGGEGSDGGGAVVEKGSALRSPSGERGRERGAVKVDLRD
jgi:hypothetical protein